MKICYMGVGTNHEKGAFSVPQYVNSFVVSSFDTPFLYSYKGELVRGKKGAILVNTPGNLVYHGSCENEECGFINDWFFVFGEKFGELLERYPLPLDEAFYVDPNFCFKRYAERLWKEFDSNYDGREEKIAAIICELVIDLYRAYCNASDVFDYRMYVTRIHDMMSVDPGKDWNIQKLIKDSGYSSSRFYEIYQEIYNVSPKQDLLKNRIAFSIQLLAYKNISLSEIAETSGFQSLFYFSRYFKKNVGCSPTEYRKQLLKNQDYSLAD